MELSEAEVQVLASLEKARVESKDTDRHLLEAEADRFWIFLEDWSDAYFSLQKKGLIEGDQKGYRLTESGHPLAQQYHHQRPDMYWYYYQRFYQAARASAAHSELCRQVFGKDLCQEGQTDMAALDDLLELLDLKPGEEVLDLGCGAGVIAEHISDQKDVSITGLDYADPAIAEAVERTKAKRSKLKFLQGDMNALDLPENSIDAVISLDTLYWVSNLEKTLSMLMIAMRPGGRMGIFMNHHIADGDDQSELAPESTDLSKALTNLGVSFTTRDFTVQIGDFWRKNWKAAADLKQRFESEGNGFIAESLIREAEEDYLPDINSGKIARYLYYVQC